MLKDTNITILSLVGSSGFALAFLGAITTLWAQTPNEDGLRSFAFALAVAFATVLGNIVVVGAHTLASKRAANGFAQLVSEWLAVALFIVGLFMTSIFFSVGLNVWFTKPPVMSPALITFVRIMILAPMLLLVVTGVMVLFSKKKDAR
jgi:uncharacterized membrane protein